jgi:3-deoxy-D-manno-octulosonic-acid transferase
MLYAAYNFLWGAVTPAAAWWLRRRPEHRRLADRFHPEVPTLGGRPLWVQACSVGEVGAAMPIVRALSERFPESPVLLTVSTVSGYDLAQQRARGVCALTWFPFDSRRTVRRFLAEARPRALVILETELWPNVLRECRRAGVPSVVVNGRLSDKHFARYARYRPAVRLVFEQLSAAGVQNETYADRFKLMGVPRDRVVVTGSTKFDAVATQAPAHVRARLRAECGFPRDAPVLLFGSTRPGDEELAAVCWRALRDMHPDLRLAVAPRHPDRLEEAIAPFDEPVLLRSRVRGGQRPDGERVFFLDTVGELGQFYATADIAVIGGSFFPGVEGHNPLEPAALGVATVFGPYMANFADPARALLHARGARQVHEPAVLPEILRELLADPVGRRNLGTRGRKAVLNNQGAIARNVELIARVLDARDGGMPESDAPAD